MKLKTYDEGDYLRNGLQNNETIQKHRWLILIVVNMFTFMATLDGSIVNVALPEITKQLHLSVSESEWIVTSYLMTVCTLILFFGRLGDIFGKVRIFQVGSIVFVAGSFLCGLSDSLPMLIGARIIQATGAAMTMSSSMGIITEIFPIKERGKALGLVGTFVSLGSITGPGLGGILVGTFGWSSIFWVNIPIGVLLVFLGTKILPKDISTLEVKIDIRGTLLFAAFIISFFSAILLGQQVGFAHIGIGIAIGISIIAFIWFILVERSSSHPMLQLGLFSNWLFSLSVLTGFLTFVANFCFNILAPFYTQSILGLSPSSAGVFLMLFPLMMAISAPISGSLTNKFGSELLAFIGLGIMVIAQAGFILLHEGSSLLYLGVLVALLGMSNGIFQAPNNTIVMSNVSKSQLGIAGSINGLVRNMGMVVGISLATTILFASMSHSMGHHVSGLVPGRPEIFMHGMRVVFIVSTIICFISLLLAGSRLLASRHRKNDSQLSGNNL